MSGQELRNGADPASARSSTIAWKVATWDNAAVLSFQNEITSGPLRHVAREQVATSSWSVEMLGDLADLVVRSDGPPGPSQPASKAWVLEHGVHHRTLVHVNNGWAHVLSASDDPVQAAATAQLVADRIRAFAPPDPTVSPVTFWALNHVRFPQKMRRLIETQSWTEITGNYSTGVQAGMQRLLALDACPRERMILWHGPPGTGKTHALRALARQWRDWCNLAYITDPENLLGDANNAYMPRYLFEVMNNTDGHGPDATSRTTLLVLEDAGELMAGDARRASAQGLSRLLNLTDGILGQGVDMMVLITTNEPLSRLHPAVIRPGRCLEELEFGPLGVGQANEWLQRHDSADRVDEPSTLAELYAITSGRLRRTAAEGEHRVPVLH